MENKPIKCYICDDGIKYGGMYDDGSIVYIINPIEIMPYKAKYEANEMGHIIETFNNKPFYVCGEDLLEENEKMKRLINKLIEMFESDEHFEDGCYCYEIYKMLIDFKIEGDK